MGNFKDLTGQKFGKLTVLRRDFSYSRPYWECQCECGNFKTVRGDSLTRGITKSCGCTTGAADILNKRFGKLVVIERAGRGDKNSRWLCKCDCGNIVEKTYSNLIKSQYPNCGCVPNRPYEDLSGQKFNLLTVINRNLDDGYGGKVKWNCICECGNKTVVTGGNLKNGTTKSCGCLTSYIEKRLGQELDNHSIVYKKQFSFDDLYHLTPKHPLRFDFAIFQNNILVCLIECQGRQYWDENSKYYTEDGIIRDNLKKEYCKKKNIPLLYVYKNEESIQKEIKEIICLLENHNQDN
jgi:hypothetical protein